MLWMISSTTLRRPDVLGTLLTDTQYIRHRERHANHANAADKPSAETANRRLPDAPLSADFLMFITVLWRPILRTIVKSAAFLLF